MAMTRREFLFAVPLCAGAVWACSAAHSSSSLASYSEIAVSKAPSADSKTIVVLMPETEQTRDVWIGLNDELSQDYRLVAVRVEGAGDVGVVAEAVARHKPAGLVLMNNPTVAAFREYQRSHAASRLPPAVVVMSSFLDDSARQVSGATGISYEVP